ncbi:uncharacterized protein TA12975 [Theileria annulata]|uniref:Uncharacterized protein n=1 Tax=Theileria annulata TaxID=5874 RepID=Q4UEA4_THEAN|nr:uncharacterized protein TA12975 [Theileria annulata]CAI74585.1 hypothetical protein TA12975 [Theileria annulata]|eukprot:XP_952317.1 hypothetical protein TA12975 [Theileria annulata]
MKKKCNLNKEVTGKSSSVSEDEDSVVEESYVLFDFPEFHSTTIFHDSKFELVSTDKDSGSLFRISNCSFDTLRINKLDTENPTCLINEYLPLNGSNILNGMTYILVNKDSLNGSSDAVNKLSRPHLENNSDVWYTSKCIEFSTDQ